MSIALEATIKRGGITQMFESFSDKNVIFVSAPAGYGKTVAVRQWFDGKKCAKAFLSLDEYDNNISSFCERFCAALYACQPQNSATCEVVSHVAFPSAPDEFTLRAIDALSARRRVVFVIDDLHFLLDDGVMKLLVVFMQRLPKTIQMVLISRNEPPTEFAGMWGSDSFALVGADSLRFSGDDILHLYKKHGKSVTLEEIADILQFTGGWPIGVGALLLSGGKPSANVLEYLDNYMLPNIWEQWDDKTREFVLCTALARELPPSLCNVLAGISDSEPILRGLSKRVRLLPAQRTACFTTTTYSGALLETRQISAGMRLHMICWKKKATGIWQDKIFTAPPSALFAAGMPTALQNVSICLSIPTATNL